MHGDPLSSSWFSRDELKMLAANTNQGHVIYADAFFLIENSLI